MWYFATKVSKGRGAKLPKFQISLLGHGFQNSKVTMRAESKYGFLPDCGYLLHSGSTLVIIIPASLRQQNQQHSIQTPHSVASGDTFNRKIMKRSVWERAFQEARVVLPKYLSERVVMLVSILEIFENEMRAFGQTIYKVELLWIE